MRPCDWFGGEGFGGSLWEERALEAACISNLTSATDAELTGAEKLLNAAAAIVVDVGVVFFFLCVVNFRKAKGLRSPGPSNKASGAKSRSSSGERNRRPAQEATLQFRIRTITRTRTKTRTRTTTTTKTTTSD